MKFDCGCEISEDGIDYINLPDCPKVWDTICEGKTKGVFQLESGLGKSWAIRAEPRSIEELSDLIAIIRPGVLESELDGKSLTKHYVDRKAGLEEIEYIHPSLEPILNKTYGILIYQEQTLLIAREIAGYSLSEADKLRKAIGKKIPEEMAKNKDLFINGCEKQGIVGPDVAKEIFDWIEKSQRYSFNKSHSISYATIGYQTAYAKTHFPEEFLCASLRYAHDKIKPKEEIAELINECKLYNIPINPPYLKNISQKRNKFHIIDGQLYFGLSDIKGFAEKECKKLLEKPDLIKSDNWEELLFGFFDKPKIAKNAVENLISSGGLDYCHVDRQQMLYEYKILSDFTDKEREWISNQSGCLVDRVKFMINSYKEYQQTKEKAKKSLSSKTRLAKVESIMDLLNNPPRDLIDSEQVFLMKEKELLGVPVTKSILCNYNTSLSNCTCSNFNSGFDADEIIICGIIKRFNKYTVKTGNNAGKEMAFLEIEDDYGSINAVVFSREFEKLCHNLWQDNALAFIGERLFSNPKDFQVKDVKVI